MKKNKLKLDELKIDSFVTAEKEHNKLKGGTITITITFFFVSDDCPGDTEWSCGSDCSMSA